MKNKIEPTPIPLADTANIDNRTRPVSRRDHGWLVAIALGSWAVTYLLVPLL